MKCLGVGADMIRPEGNGVTVTPRLVKHLRQSDALTDQSYRTLRDGLLDLAVPGISCLATIMRPSGTIQFPPDVGAPSRAIPSSEPQRPPCTRGESFGFLQDRFRRCKRVRLLDRVRTLGRRCRHRD